MKNSFNKILLLVLLIVGVVASFILINKKMVEYAFITGTISVILLFLLLGGMVGNRTPEDKYNKFLKDVLRTFDAVLINSDEIPELDGRTMVKVANFEDLIDAQVEIRKPVCYKRDDRSTLFALLDDKQLYYYILRVEENEESPFDDWVKDQKKKKVNFDKNLLSDIENTTIVKLDNNKSYRISPVTKDESKHEKKKEIKNVKKVTKELDGLPKLKDTMELSKTQLFKDMNKRIKANE